MATQAEIVAKINNLKTQIDGIPDSSFKLPSLAGIQKQMLKNRADRVILLVNNGSPNALEAAKFIIKWRIRRFLDSTERRAYVKDPLPAILSLCDEIYSDIDTLFSNSPPNAVIKIDGIIPPETFPATAGVPNTYDGRDSWDVDGTITRWVWDFGNGDIREGPVVEYAYPLGGGPYPLELTVYDDGSPPESDVEPRQVIVN